MANTKTFPGGAADTFIVEVQDLKTLAISIVGDAGIDQATGSFTFQSGNTLTGEFYAFVDRITSAAQTITPGSGATTNQALLYEFPGKFLRVTYTPNTVTAGNFAVSVSGKSV